MAGQANEWWPDSGPDARLGEISGVCDHGAKLDFGKLSARPIPA
jgi:hypothetical protein